MHIHFIAVGGAVMHQLAIALHLKGISVSGSDDDITDPARSNLNLHQILPPALGWFPERINTGVDAVILGMHAKIDNPELLKAQELGIPVYSFPEYIYEYAKDKKRIVIAGSHGKTTTTSMIMHVLRSFDMPFDYLVGAKVEGFDQSVRLSDAPVILLEGDEYPASAIEKRPKIHFYHPHISILTGIAWDHINVFPTFEIYKEQFAGYMSSMQKDAVLIYNAEDKEVVGLTEKINNPDRQIPYITPTYRIKDNKVVLNTSESQVTLSFFGDHNLQNMEAARKVCNELGIEDVDFYHSISSFHGAARRLEKISERPELVVYRDFAHAPSKLKATINAVRTQYPDHNLVACFELHTYSSLNENFLSEYAHSMDQADKSAVFYSDHALAIKGLPDINPQQITESFKKEDLHVFQDKDQLREWIVNNIQSNDTPTCLLLMSSGTFDGMDVRGF